MKKKSSGFFSSFLKSIGQTLSEEVGAGSGARAARAPTSVGVVGGGTAGLLTALALRQWHPEIKVSLIASERVPVIGVGEATTPLMVAFLHTMLGLDVPDFFAKVQPTLKLGVRFDWGTRPFNYAFGPGEVAAAQRWDGGLQQYSLSAALMEAHRAPALAEGVGEVAASLLGQQRFAYHLDNKRLVAFLRARADAIRIERIDALIVDVEVREVGGEREVSQLIAEDGRRFSYDAYVDCSGFRSLLMGSAMASPFVDYASSLPCRRAIVAGASNLDQPIAPFTSADAMPSGWCWTVPTREENHHGYVFDPDHLDDDAAEAALRARFPGVGDARCVPFRAGRREHFIRGNVVAIGNASGFVEPLQATALHMLLIQIAALSRYLARPRLGEQLNREINANWDYIRWFLALHYRFSRVDGDFWRACRADVDVSGIAPLVERFRAEGLFTATGSQEAAPKGDVVFGHRGLDVMLLGLGVTPGGLPETMSREDWGAFATQNAARVARAHTARGALAFLSAHPTSLRELTTTRSWTWEMAKVTRSGADMVGF